MIADYHVHTHLCGHAGGTIEESIQAAVARGFSEIGIADHLPLTYIDDRTLSMSAEQLPLYVEQVLELKERFSGTITVRLGIEADYHAPTLERIAGMVEAHPFDYVIGSVHAIRDWAFDDPRTEERYEGLDLDDFYIEYLETEMAMVETGLYDIVGHADLVKKFDKRATIDLSGYYRDLLERVERAGMCYEVNTAGLRWPAAEIYPEPLFIRIGAELGVPITLGSDSHDPRDVGRDFDRALALVREAGYADIAAYSDRKRTLLPLGL
jgi:histidinol-phosphatase (PHP family)